MSVCCLSERCAGCGRIVKDRQERKNHHCAPDNLVSVDRDEDFDGLEDIWEEPDEIDRLCFGLEMMEQ